MQCTAKYIKTEKLSQVYKQYMSGTVLSLKGQCHEIFAPFEQKTPPGHHMNRQKWFKKFFIFAKIFAKMQKKCVNN